MPELPTGNTLPTGTITFLFSDIEGNTPLWERDPEKLDDSRASLAEKDFSKAFEAGKAMTLEQAIVYARAQLIES